MRGSIPPPILKPQLEDAALAALRDDLQRMISAGMFIGKPPAFDAIVDRLRALESTINQ